MAQNRFMFPKLTVNQLRIRGPIREVVRVNDNPLALLIAPTSAGCDSTLLSRPATNDHSFLVENVWEKDQWSFIIILIWIDLDSD